GLRRHRRRAAEVGGVERRTQPQHHRQVLRREQLRHEVDLLDADAVLPGDAAAAADALLQDFVARRQHPLYLFAVALVEQQDRMDVAVAGLEALAAAQVVLLPDAVDLAQDVWQLRPRHDAVLRAVARRQPADGAEGLLAAFPQQQPLRVRGGPAHLAGAVPAGDLRDPLGLGFEPGLQA